MKHGSVRSENIPISLTNLIVTLPAVECAEVKRTVDIRILMSEIDALPKREEFIPLGVGTRGVRVVEEVHGPVKSLWA